MERSPPSSRATAPPLQGDRDLVVPADRVGSFLEEAYRGQLPPGIGPIEARIEGEELSVHAEVELDRLRETLRTPLPEWLRVPGKPELGLRLRVVESGNGVARLRVERVVLGGLPVPTGLLAGFLAGEVQARGFETGDDPLVRSVYLPGGFESVAVGADRTLRLERRHAP